MKKRKSPIVLVTALAIMCSVAFGLQFASSKVGGAGSQPPPPEMPDVKAVGQPRPGEAKSTVASNIKNVMAPKTGSETPEMEVPPKMGGRPGMPGQGGPMVLNPMNNIAKPEKPKPNSSATSAQWYDKDSALANQN